MSTAHQGLLSVLVTAHDPREVMVLLFPSTALSLDVLKTLCTVDDWAVFLSIILNLYDPSAQSKKGLIYYFLSKPFNASIITRIQYILNVYLLC